LKWPNDVLVGGKKIAGILLETAGRHGDPPRLCIGTGVNLLSAPPAATQDAGGLQATSLHAETGRECRAESFLRYLAADYAAWEARFATEGFPPIREAFLARAAGRGERVTARMPQQAITGIFEDIDPTGAIVLQTSDARIAIPAADIHF